jgi:hypothetical protein
MMIVMKILMMNDDNGDDHDDRDCYDGDDE